MIEVIPAAYGTASFEDCLAIRLHVFVSEQNVPPEEELDEFDKIAIHVLALSDNQPIGTARAVEKAPGIWKIGRVAVLAPYRQKGIGAALMQAIEAACPAQQLTLSAQTHALKFYENRGYVAQGPVFMEAGIPHRFMVKPGSAL